MPILLVARSLKKKCKGPPLGGEDVNSNLTLPPSPVTLLCALWSVVESISFLCLVYRQKMLTVKTTPLPEFIKYQDIRHNHQFVLGADLELFHEVARSPALNNSVISPKLVCLECMKVQLCYVLLLSDKWLLLRLIDCFWMIHHTETVVRCYWNIVYFNFTS